MASASLPDQYRTQAKVCTAMAEAAPTPEIKSHWLALAEKYEKAAASLEPTPRQGSAR